LEAVDELGLRLRRAATRPASPWVAALALAAGAALARAVVHWLPADGGDVAAARALGIVSLSILQGHSKSAETVAYFAGMASAIGASVALYCAWAIREGRQGEAPPAESHGAAKPVTARELGLVAVVLFVLFSRFAIAPYATLGSWIVLSEEGEMLAWADTVLRGGVLSRDVFCLYGPLATWPIVFLFRVFGPSVVIWRRWILGVSAAVLIGVYLLLRGLMRSRSGAFAATLVIALICSSTVPAMSWSFSRVGLGLCALACLCRSFGGSAPRWLAATGALLGVTILYSQEVGVACSLGVAAAQLLRPDRVRALAWTTLGGVAALAPFVAYVAAIGALGATVENLFLFPRIRMLGFGGLPFPELAWNGQALRGYLGPCLLAVSGFATATKLLSGDRSARVATELALFVFGLLLFSSALSRADYVHFGFALPPALVLLAPLLEDACCAAASRTAPVTRRVAASGALLLGAAGLATWWPIVEATAPSLVRGAPASYRALALPRGGGMLMPDWFASEIEQIVRAIRVRTRPDEPIWVFPNEALLYFLAERPQPTSYPLGLFAVTRAQREELVAQLERAHPAWAVVYHQATVVDGIDYSIALPEVYRYLVTHYELEGNFGGFALLRRKS
jgi:hypothetical protein